MTHQTILRIALIGVCLVTGLSGIAQTPEPDASEPAGTDAINPMVRVLLTAVTAPALTVDSDGTIDCTGDIDASVQAGPRQRLSVSIDQQAIMLQVQGRVYYGRTWRLSSERPVRVRTASGVSRQLRGALTLRIRNNRIEVINTLPLEDYLLGVVPAEMPASFAPEALKAQAVAARTYAVRERWRWLEQDADMTDDVRSQSYRGMQAENAAATAAVQATAGVVLERDSRPADVMFSADCGGFTQDTGRADAADGGLHYCEPAPNHRWRRVFTWAEITSAAGAPAEDPSVDGQSDRSGRRIDVTFYERSPRVREVRFSGATGVWTVSGTMLRTKMSLPSNLMTLTMLDNDTVVVEGSGNGHGNGLCQWGAQGRALAGQSVTQILQLYYPAAQPVYLTEALWSWRPLRARQIGR